MNKREKCSALVETLFPNQEHLWDKWWNSPNNAFNKQTPNEMFEQNPDVVLRYLLCQYNGDYS